MKPRILRAGLLLSASLLFGHSQLQAIAGDSNMSNNATGNITSDKWSKSERDVLASMHIGTLPPAPADPSNAVEKLPAAIALGKVLFQDARFSRNGAVSCASCHDPAKQFQDSRPLGQGIGTGARRTMPVIASGYSPWLFWDGRKDSVWAQALGPLEDAVEHGGNRAQYAHLLQAHYRPLYEGIFGAMPDLKGLPAHASPLGSAAEQASWRSLGKQAQSDFSRIFANMGKALAAYEKTLEYGPAKIDRYISAVRQNDKAAQAILTRQEINGLRIFIGKGECITCHNGPLLSDQHFHNTGLSALRPNLAPNKHDRGRAAAIAKVTQDEFNCLGPFSDARPESCEELRFIADADPHAEGAFKTPSLRNVALRAPYMHAGQLATLTDVIRHYVKAPAALVGHSERKPMALSESEIADLAAFLATLSGPVVER